MFGVNIGRMGRVGGSLVSPIAALFAAGEQGAWYDPSDMATLFQDSAGTTPVTAVGQSVGKVLDKSGRGNHATQSTAIKRPLLQIDGNGKYYLAFNGTNAWLTTASVDFTATDKLMVVAGLRKLSDAATGILCELSASADTNAGSFYVATSLAAAAANYEVSDGPTGARATYRSSTLYPAPITNVLAATIDRAGTTAAEEITLRANGGASLGGVYTTNGLASGNFGAYPIYIGARGGTSLFLNGQIYSLVIRGALSSAGQISAAESYTAGKTGITL